MSDKPVYVPASPPPAGTPLMRLAEKTDEAKEKARAIAAT